MPKLHAYQLRIDKQNQRVWKPTTALEEAEAEVKFNISFQGQQGHSGLGLIPTKRLDATSREHRQLVTDAMCAKDEHKQLIKVMDFAMQGAWIKWDDVMSLDLSWNN